MFLSSPRSDSAKERSENPEQKFGDLILRYEASIKSYLNQRLYLLKDLLLRYREQKIIYDEAFHRYVSNMTDEKNRAWKEKASLELQAMRESLYEAAGSDFRFDFRGAQSQAHGEQEETLIYEQYERMARTAIELVESFIQCSLELSKLTSELDRRSFLQSHKKRKKNNESASVQELAAKRKKCLTRMQSIFSDRFFDVIAELARENEALIAVGRNLATTIPIIRSSPSIGRLSKGWGKIVFFVRRGDAIIHMFAHPLGKSKSEISDAVKKGILPPAAEPGEYLVVPDALNADDPHRLLAEVRHDKIQKGGSEWALFMSQKMADVLGAMLHICKKNQAMASLHRLYFLQQLNKQVFSEYRKALDSIMELIKKLGIGFRSELGKSDEPLDDVFTEYILSFSESLTTAPPDGVFVEAHRDPKTEDDARRLLGSQDVGQYDEDSPAGESAPTSARSDYDLSSAVFQGKSSILRQIDLLVARVNAIGSQVNRRLQQLRRQGANVPRKIFLPLFTFDEIQRIENEAGSRTWIVTRSGCRMPEEIYERFMNLKKKLLSSGYYLFPTETDKALHQSIGHYELNIVDAKAANIRRAPNNMFVYSLITPDESKRLVRIILENAILENAWKPDYAEALKSVEKQLLALKPPHLTMKAWRAEIESLKRKSHVVKPKTSIFKIALLNEYVTWTELKTGGHLHIEFL